MNKNIAVLGVGKHSINNTIPAIVECHNLNLLGCYSRNNIVSKQIAMEYGIKFWNLESELYSDNEVDIIYIATPTGIHFNQIHQALLSGKHVFCEKSLVTSLSETQLLCDLAQDKGLVLAECFMYLYHKQFKYVLKTCRDGAIGNIKSIIAKFGYPHLDLNNFRYKEKLGGGALLDAGVYPLSFMLEFFNNKIVNLTGNIETDIGFEVDTGGSALMLSDKNIAGVSIWGMGRDYANEVTLWGTEGKIKIERAFSKPVDFCSEVQVSQNGEIKTIRLEADNHFVNMFKEFSRAIDDKSKRKNLINKILNLASIINSLNNKSILDKRLQ